MIRCSRRCCLEYFVAVLVLETRLVHVLEMNSMWITLAAAFGVVQAAKTLPPPYKEIIVLSRSSVRFACTEASSEGKNCKQFVHPRKYSHENSLDTRGALRLVLRGSHGNICEGARLVCHSCHETTPQFTQIARNAWTGQYQHLRIVDVGGMLGDCCLWATLGALI